MIPKPEQYLLDDLLPFEKAYPIYSVDVRWLEDIGEREFKGNWIKDAPEGKFYNRTQWYIMFKEELDVEAKVKEFLTEWWPGFVERQAENDKKRYGFTHNVGEPTITIEFKMWETWKCEWFGHHTFDTGQTNEEVLCSFQRFVDRALCQNDREPDSRALMGAEDRFRWSGEEPEDRSPPCRCEHCKEQGIIRIRH